MKNSLTYVVLLSAAFFISCGSHQNFSSRKYTKGKFRVVHKQLRSTSPELEDDRALATIEEEQLERLRTTQLNLFEETTRELSEALPMNELSSVSTDADQDEIQVEPNSTVSAGQSKYDRKPQSEIAASSTAQETKEQRKLSGTQRKARSSLIWGIVAISLMAMLITIAVLSLPMAFPFPYALLFASRSVRIALIPAVVGIVQSTIAKFGNEDLGKYEKHRKVGFWLSISTLLVWALLV